MNKQWLGSKGIITDANFTSNWVQHHYNNLIGATVGDFNIVIDVDTNDDVIDNIRCFGLASIRDGVIKANIDDPNNEAYFILRLEYDRVTTYDIYAPVIKSNEHRNLGLFIATDGHKWAPIQDTFGSALYFIISRWTMGRIRNKIHDYVGEQNEDQTTSRIQ